MYSLIDVVIVINQGTEEVRICIIHRCDEKCIQNLVGNLRRTNCSERPRHRLYDAMKVNLKKTGCDGMQ
jgi:hypothetical protein